MYFFFFFFFSFFPFFPSFYLFSFFLFPFPTSCLHPHILIIIFFSSQNFLFQISLQILISPFHHFSSFLSFPLILLLIFPSGSLFPIFPFPLFFSQRCFILFAFLSSLLCHYYFLNTTITLLTGYLFTHKPSSTIFSPEYIYDLENLF